MNKFYKTLIVITAAISLFFLLKWAWQFIPQYKTVESFSSDEDICSMELIDDPSAHCFCGTVVELGNELDIFNKDGSVSITSTPEIPMYVCYESKRVRTN